MRVLRGAMAAGVFLAAGFVLAAEPETAADRPVDSAFQAQGRVVDEDGRGLPEVNVEATSIYRGEQANVRTDGSGRFTLKLPHKPSYALLLRVVEDGGARQAFAGFLFEKAATGLDIEPELPDEIELVVRSARRIDVTVVDGDQQPVADARVFVSATWSEKLAQAGTDAAGDATLLVPADAPLSSVVAVKPGAGLDYFLYQSRGAAKRNRYRLPHDHAEPLTFVLGGVHPVTVNVVDENGRPLAGASVRATSIERPRKGENSDDFRERGVLYTSGFDDLQRFTDRDGKVTLDYLPADGVRAVPVDAWVRGYRDVELPSIDPGSVTTEVTATLWRTIPLRGRVTFNDGRPAAGAAVSIVGKPLDPRGRSGNTTVFTDDRGFFEADAFPNGVYFMNCRLDHWAAPPVDQVVLDKPPESELRIVLDNATRVYGRLTVGPEHRPLANQTVGVSRYAEDEDRKLDEYRKAISVPPAPQPAPTRPRAREEPHINFIHYGWSTTDEQGEFEIFLPPGKYQLSHSAESTVEFEIDGEAERELNLHSERPIHEELTGRVGGGGDGKQAVGDASVIAYYISRPGLYHIETTTDADGAFRLSRQRFDLLLYARSADGLLAGTARVAANEASAVVSLRPAARAHGRLLDAATGETLRNTVVFHRTQWDRDAAVFQSSGSVRTDELGEFTAVGLLPGRQYSFEAQLTAGYRGNVLTRVTPDGPELVELGDFKLDPSGRVAARAAAAEVPRGIVGRNDRPNIYDPRGDGNEQIAAALKAAKAENKHVLLQFGTNRNHWCHHLHECFQDQAGVAAVLRESYVVVLIDVDQAAGKQHNADIVARYEIASLRGFPVLVVLDADGGPLKTKECGELRRLNQIDPTYVLEFLIRWKPK